jgi:hypothetical protein
MSDMTPETADEVAHNILTGLEMMRTTMDAMTERVSQLRREVPTVGEIVEKVRAQEDGHASKMSDEEFEAFFEVAGSVMALFARSRNGYVEETEQGHVHCMIREVYEAGVLFLTAAAQMRWFLPKDEQTELDRFMMDWVIDTRGTMMRGLVEFIANDPEADPAHQGPAHAAIAVMSGLIDDYDASETVLYQEPKKVESTPKTNGGYV